MRNDAVGIFWQDIVRKGGKAARPMPPIPDTGWTTPTEFPNLRAARALAIDTETFDPELNKKGPGWARSVGHIVGISVAVEDGQCWYFPFRHEVEPTYNMEPEHVLSWAKDTLTDPRQAKIGANLIYDVGWLRQEGIFVQGPLYDVQYAEALLTENRTVNLDDLGKRYLNMGKVGEVLYEWCATYYGGKETQKQRENIFRAPPRLVGPYAEVDAVMPFEILKLQWTKLQQEDLLDIYLMECKLIYLIIEMRYAGVTVDINVAKQLREMLTTELKQIDDQISNIVGFPINTNKSSSMASAFDVLGLPYGYTENNSPSFTTAFLKTVNHPLARLCISKKEHEKLRGTFIDGYILDSHIEGKVYGQFHQLRGDAGGTRSGRFSSSTPNLQNIPARTELGRQVRRAFVPDRGHLRWIKLDYNQIEYRILAHYATGAEADGVRRRYRLDPSTDFHDMVQEIIQEIVGLVLDRPLVKNINFGTVYGMGKRKLSEYLGVSPEKAKELFAAIHKAAPFMKQTMDDTMEEADQLGYITTITGRRSRFNLWVPEVYTEDARPVPYEEAILRYRNPRRAGLHKALNRRLQGTAADLLKLVMLQCWEGGIFDTTGVPRLTVHDELGFSDPGGVDEAFGEIQHLMETAIKFSVPIKVKREVGPSWGEVG